jgi:hypothetical protein
MVPAVLGEYVTVHELAGGLLPATVLRVQGLLEKLPLAADAVIVPVGLVLAPAAVLVTVVVQVVLDPVLTVDGLHVTAVLVLDPVSADTYTVLLAVTTVKEPLQLLPPGMQSFTLAFTLADARVCACTRTADPAETFKDASVTRPSRDTAAPLAQVTGPGLQLWIALPVLA